VTLPNRTLLVIAAVAAIVAIVTFQRVVASKPDGSDQQSLAGLSQRMDALERRQQVQMTALQDRMDTLLGASGLTAPTSAAAGAGLKPAPHLLGLTAEDQDPVREARDRDALLRTLESEHARETIDAAWAGPAEARLLSSVKNPAMLATGLRPKSIDTDCRSRSCRIDASFGSSGDAEDWATFYLTSVGTTLAQSRLVILPQPDGTTRIRIYGGRK
jgi:hypothetical protein